MRKFSIILLFLVGLSLIFYPSVSQKLAQMNHIKVIEDFNTSYDESNREKFDIEIEKAKEFNNSLLGQSITDPFVPNSGFVIQDNYYDIMADSIIANLEIPVIDVLLPILHGTSDEVLKKGVGHLSETAFPIGGENNHSVLTGHTGLPSSYLLNDLNKLVLGDEIYINFPFYRLKYKVIEITTVLPNETDNLKPQKGKDLLTVLTCTPYGVNSHRLLVTSEFVEKEEEFYVPSEELMSKTTFSLFWIIAFYVLILLIVYRIRSHIYGASIQNRKRNLFDFKVFSYKNIRLSFPIKKELSLLNVMKMR